MSGDTPPRVLFVDDEVQVLDALRSSLRKDRRRFDFSFATSGAEALAILECNPVDVVVTDMRMPGMTGADLIERLRETSPGTIRMVLSGEADEGLVMRSVAVAHQWLNKPCSRRKLVASLDSALRYRSLLTRPEIREAVAGVGALPSPPRLHLKILELATSPSTTTEEIAAAVELDPAVAAKLLQLANSAFSMGLPVRDLQAAIVRIGLRHLAQLVLSIEVLNSWDAATVVPGLDLQVNADLSHLAAVASGMLAPPESVSPAGIAGLLNNVGLLLEAARMPDRLSAACQLATERGTTLIEAERELYGVTHPELGGHLLSIWGLPTDVVLGVAGSHDAPVSLDRELGTVDAVRVGFLAAQQCFSDDQVSAIHRLPVPAELQSLVDETAARLAPHAEVSSHV